jgi:hypothetical protein
MFRVDVLCRHHLCQICVNKADAPSKDFDRAVACAICVVCVVCATTAATLLGREHVATPFFGVSCVYMKFQCTV